ncbi:MAG: putative collagen-binding domain-containing protein, partial [Ginsengibacter sp.]
SKASLQSAEARVLAQPGKQYAVYFYGQLPATLELLVPAGSYKLSWMDTKTGVYTTTKAVGSANGKITVSPPAYIADIALRIVSSE